VSGSVKKDDNRGTWYFVIDARSASGRRQQIKRRGFATKKAAQTALRNLSGQIDTGRAAHAGRLTFGTFLTDRWLPAIDADPKLKQTTKAGHRRMVAHLTNTEYGIGGLRLADLAGDDLDRLYGALRELGKSERTVRYVHTTAHRALSDACRWRLVTYNAASEATAPAQTTPQPQAWTPAQITRFLEASASDRWATLFRLAVTTGMRRGELCALRWHDIDLEAGTLTVSRSVAVIDHELVESSPKSSRSRQIGLDRATVAALTEWRRTLRAERLAFGEGWAGGERLAIWPDGSQLHPNVLTRTFGRIAVKAGLPPLRLHGLRHSWATNALRAGVRTKVVADRLGHSSTRVTDDIYTAFVDELDRDAAERVADLYSAQS
jgi:integrase